MPRIINEEWRDKNADRRYPFSDEATLTSADGRSIPTALFLDAAFWEIPGGNNIYLSSIEVADQLITFSVSVSATEDFLGDAEIDIGDNPDLVYIRDTFNRPIGVLVIDATLLVDIRGWGAGVHQFSEDATSFAVSTVAMAVDTGVKGLLLPDGSVLSGDVWLVGEGGVELWSQDGAIRVDVVGDPLKDLEDCINTDETAANAQASRQPLRTINSIPADEFGDFQILVGRQLAENQILRINPITNGITIKGSK